MDPLAASLVVVVAAALITPIALRRRAAPLLPQDGIWAAVGALVMIASAALQTEPASAWSPLVDLGSFAVGTSLVVVSPPMSWPRHVGMLILGIHGAQVLFTNENSTFGGMA